MSIALAVYSVGLSIVLGFLGLALNLSARSLILPYGMLLYSLLALAAFLYWARTAYERPKACALRLASAIFFSLLLFLLALAYSVVRVGLLPLRSILYYFAPCILPGSALTSLLVYVLARRRLETANLG